MEDIFENIHKINEQQDYYRNNVPLEIYFESPGLDDDQYEEVPDNVELTYDIEIEHRSWGVKDINVFLRGIVEFDVIIRSDLPDEEGKEIIIPVKIDFLNIDSEITWLEGSGIAPAGLQITLGGEKGDQVKKVEIDFYYWKP